MKHSSAFEADRVSEALPPLGANDNISLQGQSTENLPTLNRRSATPSSLVLLAGTGLGILYLTFFGGAPEFLAGLGALSVVAVTWTRA